MRFSFLLLSLFVATPELADRRYESIHLNYLSPEAARAVLLSNTVAQAAKTLDTVEAPSGVRFLLPMGITAVAANPLDRTITVAGDPEAIEQVMRVLRLLDVPPRRLRISVEVLRFKPGSQLPVKTTMRTVSGRTRAVSVCENLTSEQTERVRALSAERLLDVSVESINNGPISVFPRRTSEAKPAAVSLLARVNGDGSIALKIAGNGFDSTTGVPTLVSGRMFSGSPCLMVPTEGEVWLFRTDVLPDRPPHGD